MISRFDHTVIAVRDLDAAIERYRALGFEVNQSLSENLSFGKAQPSAGE